MHTKNILGTVVAVFIFMTPSFIFGQKSKGAAEAMGLSVKQETELLLTNLKKNIKKEKVVNKRFTLIEKFKKDYTALRKKNARQLENDEIAMDIFITALEMIPVSGDFKKTECPQYREKILRDMSPNSDQGEKVDPSTQSSLDVLSLLCK